MKKKSSVGFNSLAWVKHEIDHSLDLARTEINSYAEAPEKTHHLDRALSLLRDVQGTLDVAELEGAAMLAEESLEVIKGLEKQSITNVQEACKQLIRALIQLPDYLDYVQTGQDDTPLVLVSVLNDLRAVRKVDFVSDRLGGISGLENDGQVLDNQMHSGEDLQSIAELTRLVFELGLLGWYRNSNVEESLGKMALVCRRLRVASKHRASRRLWWSAEALTEALQSNRLEPSDSIKTLLGRVDREIKRLFNVGEDTFSATISLDLVKSLLYYIAISKPGNAVVDEVRNAYFLDDDVPSAESLEGFQTSLSGHNKALNRSVAMSLAEDLEEIKEHLDHYHRSPNQSLDDLQVLVPLLARLGETFATLELDAEAKEVATIRETLNQALSEKRTPSKGELETVAQKLIEFEHSITQFGINDQTVRQAGSEGNKLFQPSDEQFDDVRSIVIKEVLQDIDTCKAQIQRYASNLCSISELSGTLAHFSQVAGAMHLLSLDNAGSLVTDIHEYLALKIEQQSDFDANQLDYLAESIAAVEVYLEVLEASKIEQESFIQTGRSSLNVLRAVQAEPEETGENTAFLSMTPEIESLSTEDVTAAEIPVLEEPVTLSLEADEVEIPDLESLDPAEQEQPIQIEEQVEDNQLDTVSLASGDQSMEIPDVGELPDFEAPTGVELAVDADNASIDELDASLITHDPDASSESLVEMFALDPEEVGTLDIEFTATDAFNVNDADSAGMDLHEMAATLNGNEGLETDFVFDESLIDSLQSQSPSEIQGMNFDMTAVEASSAPAQVSQDSGSTQLPEILHGKTIIGAETDDEIYEIFREELGEEIARLDQQFPKWKADSTDEPPLIQSRRSFHTIKGSGRLVGAQIIGEFAWVHESILNQVIDGLLRPEPEVIACLEKGIELLPHLKQQLEQRQFSDDEVNRHIVWAEKISNGELNTDWMVGSAPVDKPSVEKSIEEFDAAELDADEPLPTLSAISVDSVEFGAEETQSGIDPELMEIFVADAQRNLKLLKESATAAENSETWIPGEAVIIAVHTLNGSSRTAEVKEIAEPFSACEKYMRAKLESSEPFDRRDAEAILNLTEHANTVLKELESESVRSNGTEIGAVFVSLKEQLPEQLPQTPAFDPTQTEIDAVFAESDEPSAIENQQAVESDDELPELALEAAKVAQVSESESQDIEADEPSSDTSHVILESLDLPDSPPSAGSETVAATMVSELVAVFVDECNEILENCDDSMVRWQKDNSDLAPVGEIKRELHTLKGSSRMAGIDEIGNLSHAMETLLADVSEGRVAVSSDVFSVTHAVFDRINSLATAVRLSEPLDSVETELGLLEKVRAGKALSEADFRSIAEVEDELEEIPVEDDFSVEPEPEEPQEEQLFEELQGELDLPGAPTALPVADSDGRLQEAIRIRAELLDRLVDNIGEVNVFHSRVEQQVGSFEFNLKELDQTIRRVTEQLRSLEMEAEAQILHRHKDMPVNPEETAANEHFDPLELDRYSKLQQLSRSLAESTGDLKNIHQLLVDEVGGLDNILQQQSRVSNDLQDGLMQTRMSKFKVMAPRLRRVVRRSAMDLGKEVELSISGDNNELDRKMLESIIVPLEHLLRNAVAHGIETPQLRQEAGKERSGEVNVSISREGPQIVITVADNGAGINEERVVEQALRTGLISDSDSLSPEEIHALILRPGFTTADEVNQVAGRGVGMDVVAAQLKQLNGVLDIKSESGKGAEFRISIPFTLAINQALLVTSNKGHYAIPMGSIEGVLQISGRSLAEKLAAEPGSLTYAGDEFKISQMSSVLEKVAPQSLNDEHVYPVLLGRVGDSRVGFVVDEILGNREIVVKPVGPLLGALQGISGATILGDGQIVLILDIAGMIRQTLEEQKYQDVPGDEEEISRKLVMVVDDSITIRKVTSRMLERHNFSVVTAKDGLDAVAQLQDVRPDMMLLDIEMPRMDGFELAEHVRNSQESAELPIIMISSRTGKKHRERAQQLGVNQFLGKPYQDQELLENINFLLDGGRNEHSVVH